MCAKWYAPTGLRGSSVTILLTLDGVRRAKVSTFDSVTYPIERDRRLAVQGELAALNVDTLAGKVGVTFGRSALRCVPPPAVAPRTFARRRSAAQSIMSVLGGSGEATADACNFAGRYMASLSAPRYARSVASTMWFGS